MRVLIASNSFKHCLSARAAGEAMARGVRAARPDAEIQILPLSDGGDGLIDVLAGLPGARRMESPALDPLLRPFRAAWLISPPDAACLELALASGLALLRPDERRPLEASTAGTGLLIRAALEAGCRRIALGLGGSATVDAGCGLASALGFRFLDRAGNDLPPGGGALVDLDRIDAAGADPRLAAAAVVCPLDVTNPLLGPEGAARVFGPQKGAGPAAVERLEAGLARWADVVRRDLGVAAADLPGGGAAGGAGAGAAAFLGATLVPGAEWVAGQVGLEAALARADLVFTGEGRLDAQTAFGKVPAFVARRARARGKPCVALGGSVAPDFNGRALGFARCAAATPAGVPLETALRDAEIYLARAAADLMMALSIP